MLSPNGAWIAATAYGASASADHGVLLPRAGGAAVTLPAGINCLGWLQGRLVYAQGAAIYTMRAPDGAPRSIGTLPVAGQPLSAGPAGASPDDTALAIIGSDGATWIVSAGGVHAPPSGVLPGQPLFWVGPHAALAITAQGALVSEDVMTGAIVRTLLSSGANAYGANAYGPQAVAGAWLAARLGPRLELINTGTGARVDLGIPPTQGPALPVGDGFALDGPAAIYAVLPTS